MINQTSSLELSHYPVMLSEILKISSPNTGGKFIDCTFGGGSYSREILKFPHTTVESFDRDKEVFVKAKEIEKKFPNRFKFYQIKFSQIKTVSKEKADIIIFDLGLSSIQLNNYDRGFSFKSEKKLNMAMGLNEISAFDVINKLDEENLKLVIKILGEEKEASKIVQNIVKQRKINKITKTSELVSIINKSKKKNSSKKIDPCTKTFQALRIFVNKEITELINGLINATERLKPGGKIIVVSFHSIEDKIVKYLFTNFSNNKSRSSRYLPENNIGTFSLFENYKNKAYRPSQKEISNNSRSRSAKLRFAVRNKNEFEYPKEFIKKFKRYIDLEATHV